MRVVGRAAVADSPGMAPHRVRRAPLGRGAAARTLLVAVVATSAACDRAKPATGPPAIVLGVGSTDEQRVLAALSIVALDAAGIPVEPHVDLGSTVDLRRAASSGEIDLWWDYTGAAWALGLGEQGPPADPVESYERVREADVAQGFTWLAPAPANATLALFVREEDLPAEGATLTWLAGELSGGRGSLCADPDFLERPAGYPALAQEYSIEVDRVEQVPLGELKAIDAVAEGRCFAGLASATSGPAALVGLRPVVDDQRLFPAFVTVPVVRADAMERGLDDALAAVTERLGTADLRALNAAVAGGAEPRDAAEEFLADIRETTEQPTR